jgi:hypothetical protein
MNETSEPFRKTVAGFAAEPAAAKATSALALLRTVGSQLLIISDAQFSIWKMKLIRLAAMALLTIPLAIGFLALAVYGFVLLDAAAAAGMRTAEFPEWVSPLVRGGFYSVFVLFVMISFWRQAIGSVAAKK